MKCITSLLDKLAEKIIRARIVGSLISEVNLVTVSNEPTHSDPAELIVVKVHFPRFYRVTLLCGSLGAARSYVRGEWTCNRLVDLMETMLHSQQLIQRLETGAARFHTLMSKSKQLVKRNTQIRGKRNILAHYDVGNQFYELILDAKLMYSAAVFTAANTTDLEIASEYKLQRVCQWLNLCETDHVCEIGTGWGGFAIYAATHYGCRVTTTTVSDKQYSYVAAKIKALGLEHKITLLNKDYRQLTGTYDKLVSIEMIEAVGYHYFPTYFDICNRLLKNNGLFFLQAIVMNDQKFSRYKRQQDFINTDIFPGGCLPSLNEINKQLGKRTLLQLIKLESIGQSYAKTLSLWREKLLAQQQAILQLGYDEQFIRRWEFYFSYCQAGFQAAYIDGLQILIRKNEVLM